LTISDWTIPPATVAIATTPRSGSYHLCELVTQTDRLGRPEEYFHRAYMRNKFPGRARDWPDRLRLLREHGASSNGVLGVKIFPRHLPAPKSGLRLSDYLGPVSWVWLRRRDVVGQAISFDLAIQRNAFVSSQPHERQAVYSARAIAQHLETLTAWNAQWEAFFARTRVPVLQLYYEDVEADPQAAVEAVARHAGQDIEGFRVAPPTKFLKQRDGLNEQWRDRFHADLGTTDRLSFLPRPRGGVIGRWLNRLAVTTD
jgi:LPS sulfotransferase NodH